MASVKVGIGERFAPTVLVGNISMPPSGSASTRSRIGNKKKRITLARLYDRCGGICYHCRRRIPFGEATRDHYLPAILGGPYEWYNFRLACAWCNNNRNTRELDRIAELKRSVCPNCPTYVPGGSVLRCYGNPMPIRVGELERLIPQAKVYRNAKRNHICKLSKQADGQVD